jgi:glucosamine--fructose-6-phosphate aminotransferase (isomerizing)
MADENNSWSLSFSLSDIWETILVENANDDLLPFLLTIPLQKLAYYSALKKGYDIDKPRNLAKSVTVE